jgi:hypothetical protein
MYIRRYVCYVCICTPTRKHTHTHTHTVPRHLSLPLARNRAATELQQTEVQQLCSSSLCRLRDPKRRKHPFTHKHNLSLSVSLSLSHTHTHTHTHTHPPTHPHTDTHGLSASRTPCALRASRGGMAEEAGGWRQWVQELRGVGAEGARQRRGCGSASLASFASLPSANTKLYLIYACMYVCMFVYIHIYIHTLIYIYL